MEPDEKAGLLGCLGTLVAVAVVVALFVWMSGQDMLGTSTTDPLTRVAPSPEKRMDENARAPKPTATKASTEETPPEAQGRATGVTAAVVGLDSVTMEDPLPPEVGQGVQEALNGDPVCYQGRMARKVSSMFTRHGFAIAYGADDYNSGDPLPRLEVFFGPGNPPRFATYMSMTKRTFAEFPIEQETAIDYSSEVIGAVIAKWVATVATEKCPAAVQ
jgi:hypothetical protein